jgi:hypothetical protein
LGPLGMTARLSTAPSANTPAATRNARVSPATAASASADGDEPCSVR